MGCSLGCLLRQGVFPLIGQHAEGLPVPQCVHTPLPGGSVCALYSLAPGNWHCAEARLPHIPRGQSPPENRKQVSPMARSLLENCCMYLIKIAFQGNHSHTHNATQFLQSSLHKSACFFKLFTDLEISLFSRSVS